MAYTCLYTFWQRCGRDHRDGAAGLSARHPRGLLKVSDRRVNNFARLKVRGEVSQRMRLIEGRKLLFRPEHVFCDDLRR